MESTVDLFGKIQATRFTQGAENPRSPIDKVETSRNLIWIHPHNIPTTPHPAGIQHILIAFFAMWHAEFGGFSFGMP
jgi:hypothetical protein